MKFRLVAIFGVVAALAFAAWSISLIVSKVSVSLFDAEITINDAFCYLLVVVSLLAVVVVHDLCRVIRSNSVGRGFISTRIAWVMGLLATNANIISAPSPSIATSTPQLTAAVTPAVAVSVLAEIERRRRTQIKHRVVPDQLSIQELEVIHDLQQSARIASTRAVALHVEAENVCPLLMRAIDRPAPSKSFVVPTDAMPWLVEVKVFGYPTVVAANGAVAEFRKKRALELLTWLSLNRDKARRSAARTALWDIDVSDSAFATVVSDMRRALREVEQTYDADQWVPATYSDELPLSDLVTTDAERLQETFRRYKEADGGNKKEIIELLKGIRDVPFAGTNYVWADYDGTTTRLVINAVSMCCEIARCAQRNSDHELFATSVSAGLRVLPGCEELLEIQEEFLSTQFMTRPAKLAQQSFR